MIKNATMHLVVIGVEVSLWVGEQFAVGVEYLSLSLSLTLALP